MACRSEYSARVSSLAVSRGLPERTMALGVSSDKHSGDSRALRLFGVDNRQLERALSTQGPIHQSSPTTYLLTVHDTTMMAINAKMRASTSRGVFNVPKCAQPKSRKVSHTSWLQPCLQILCSVAYQSANQNTEVTASPWPLPPSRLTVPVTAPGLAVALPSRMQGAI